MNPGDIGPEVVDVEVAIGVGSARNALAVFLHHPNEDGRIEAESVAWGCGAEFVPYPTEQIPLPGTGRVEIRGAALYVSIGRMYVISPLTMKSEETAGIDRAVVFFTDTPFDPADQSEKTWLAVHLPLVHSSEENT